MQDTKELRGDCPADLVRALDALALSRDRSRNEYVVEVLAAHVKRKLNELSLAHRMLTGNPLYPAFNRSDALHKNGVTE